MAKLCIGLDIGSSAVKVVQLNKTKRNIQLANFGIEPVPSESIVDGTMMRQSDVADSVRSLFSHLKVKRREVALAIAGHSVIIKKIKMPAMTSDELDEQIQWEAEHHIPFAKDDVEIDHQIISTDRKRNQMEVLLVAAKKEVVADYAGLAREAQLNPVILDVAAFALQNCYEQNYGVTDDVVGLVNVGASISTINIVSAGQSLFTRDVTLGGNAFTEEIQKQLDVDYEEAEAYKCGGTAGDEVVPEEVEEILTQQADLMASEFQRSFDFFLGTHTADGRLDRILICGGTSRVPALRRALEERARISVEILDPFRNISVDGKMFDMEYMAANAANAAIAVGLALRSEGDS